MANHKRKRPKDRRAGCLMCKPHKSNGQKHTKGGYGKLTIRDLKQPQFHVGARND